ncbi:hypothetical protein FF38_08762 [Lucilia cuprina]|uniref:Uncharacterized protein n=1 Tax=Lucilia cuprina TaxID=7375 RepID=A0A0L0CMV2_LUCCU|nr:hypothetical protein FF38_08762 [Lucilia cuprina]
MTCWSNWLLRLVLCHGILLGFTTIYVDVKRRIVNTYVMLQCEQIEPPLASIYFQLSILLQRVNLAYGPAIFIILLTLLLTKSLTGYTIIILFKLLINEEFTFEYILLFNYSVESICLGRLILQLNINICVFAGSVSCIACGPAALVAAAAAAAASAAAA